MNASVTASGEGRLRIEGPMTMESAAALLAEAAPQVVSADATLDLSAVSHVDSAALSVVLALLRAATAAGRKLTVANVPAAFSSLAALYGVDTLLAGHLIAHDAH